MKVIKPLVDPPKEIIRKLLYPYTLYKIEVRIRRPLKPPRIVNLIISVDKFRAKGYISDKIPELIEEDGDIIPARVTGEQADKIAHRVALYYALKKWRVGLAPDIVINERIDTYKIFWLSTVDNKRIIIDSVSGDWEFIDKEK